MQELNILKEKKSSFSLEQLELKCGVCLNYFNTEKIPMGLSNCTHYFCLACLKTLGESNIYKCPYCRTISPKLDDSSELKPYLKLFKDIFISFEKDYFPFFKIYENDIPDSFLIELKQYLMTTLNSLRLSNEDFVKFFIDRLIDQSKDLPKNELASQLDKIRFISDNFLIYSKLMDEGLGSTNIRALIALVQDNPDFIDFSFGFILWVEPTKNPKRK